jgi:hypothetical protein
VAPNPDSRHQSAAAFAAELRSVAAVLDSRGLVGDEEDLPEVVQHGSRGVLALALVVLLIAVAIVWWLWR